MELRGDLLQVKEIFAVKPELEPCLMLLIQSVSFVCKGEELHIAIVSEAFIILAELYSVFFHSINIYSALIGNELLIDTVVNKR